MKKLNNSFFIYSKKKNQMELKNISTYLDFKTSREIDMLLEDSLARDYASNTTNFSNSLLGRGTISLLKFFKRGLHLAKLEIYRRKFENELIMGVLRTYEKYKKSESSEISGETGDEKGTKTDTKKTVSREIVKHKDNLDIVKYKNTVGFRDDNSLIILDKGNVIKYKVGKNGELIARDKVIPISSIQNKDDIIKIMKLINTGISKEVKKSIPDIDILKNVNTDDIISMIDSASENDKNDDNFYNSIQELYKSLPDSELKKRLKSFVIKYHPDKRRMNLDKLEHIIDGSVKINREKLKSIIVNVKNSKNNELIKLIPKLEILYNKLQESSLINVNEKIVYVKFYNEQFITEEKTSIGKFSNNLIGYKK